jgi:hypothetical protein
MSATKCAKAFFSLIYPNRSIDCAIGGNMTQPSKERDTNTSIYDATSGNNKIPSEEVHTNTSINAPNSGSRTLKKKEKPIVKVKKELLENVCTRRHLMETIKVYIRKDAAVYHEMYFLPHPMLSNNSQNGNYAITR